MSLTKLIQSLKAKNNFIITSHVAMEGDALGSELALYLLLKALGKKVTVINDDVVSDEYSFMPLREAIVQFKDLRTPPRCDCFILVDCSDLARCARVSSLILKGRTQVLNIDHHISNEKFGDINWLKPQASSASEMVYSLYRHLRLPFTRESATLLYVGMMTDTGSFHYSNTSRSTHQAVVDLLRYGVDISHIYKNVYENISFDDMKLLNKIAGEMQSELDGKLVWMSVGRSIMQKKSSFDFSEHLLSFARALRNVEVVVLFKELVKEKNKVRVNFRSQGSTDVSTIATFFGGGGHKAASGATVEGPLRNVQSKVLAKVRSALRSAQQPVNKSS